MNRFLHRPMFRKGGSASGGITSGLAPRQGYSNGEWVKQVLPTEEEISTLQNLYGKRPRSTNLNDFLISFGLDLAGRSPQGNIFQTAAQSAKEPFAKFQERKMYEQEAPRQERADLINTIISGKAEALAGESAASIFKDEKIAGLAKETLNRMFKHDDSFDPSWSKDSKEYIDWQREKKRIDSDLDQFEQQTGIDLEFIIKESGSTEAMMDKYKKELQQNDSPMIGSDGQPMTDEDGEVITISDYYTDTANAGELQIKLIEMIGDEVAKMKSKRRGWKHAEGGRAGYQAGELVEQEDVNIQTPQGDVDMQETVEEDRPSDQLSYEELRSRLPVEITDDIVRLLVSSTAALGDFAQIQTQQDVDNFNAKYGVNLVLPSEA